MSLRGLDPDLVARLEREAKKRGLSLNRTVLVLLREALGAARPEDEPTIHEDLDHLAGTWSARQADAFERKLGEQRRIDQDLWK
jgi:hypothetical protein